MRCALAFVPPEELAEIEGFDENVADELIRRAQTFLARRDEELTERRRALGVSDEVAAFEAFTPAMLVTLGDVLFEFGRAEIKPQAQEAIAKLSNYLKQHPDRRVLIEGFTDSVGSDQANLTLSQRRSQAVAAALSANGIDPTRVDTRGYGEAYPVASNTSTSDRAMNRRVEVYISNDNQPVRARG